MISQLVLTTAVSMSLLDGRLDATAPSAMRLEPRQPSIMSAEASNAEETRAVLDEKGTRLVMMVYELFVTAGADVEGTLARETKGGPPARITEAKLPAYGQSLTPAGESEANLVYQAWVVRDDGVQRFDFYVNAAGVKDAPRWAATARTIVASVTPGATKLHATGGRVVLAGGEEALTITLPASWIVTAQQGPDFVVYTLRNIVRLGEKQATGGIYFGGHPALHAMRRENKPQTSRERGTLFGKSMSWTTWSNDGQPFSEVIVDYPKDDHLKVHVWCNAPAARDILATLQ